MKKENEISLLLEKKFDKKYCAAAIKHFNNAVHQYSESDWEGSISAVGKFVEATLKCLLILGSITLPTSRNFRVSQAIQQLDKLDKTTFADSIRLIIPRACTFIYDIACNRGARHDSHEIDSNVMDATVAIPVASWILSELVRISDAGNTSPQDTMTIVNELLTKKYPYSENIDGRIYINLKNLSALETGLLILNFIYPNRLSRQNLIEQIERHGHKKTAAATAVSRLVDLIDDKNGDWKLRGLGREKAEEVLLKRARN